jgi:chemotaxis protein CheX
MDETLVRAFRSSAVITFKDMFGLDAEAGVPSQLSADEDHGWDITGLVGLAGQAQGVVAVRLAASLLERLFVVSGVTAAGDKERKELESGLVGELTNIIAGHAASDLHGIDIEIAPPVVVRGPNHHIGWPGIAPVVKMPFSLSDGGFEVDLCMKL